MIDILPSLLFNLLFVIVFFVALFAILKMSVRTIKRRNKQFTRRFYLKEFPLILNYQMLKRTRIVGEFVGVALLTAIVAFTFFNNVTPLGITVFYDMTQNSKSISQLGPKNRVAQWTYGGQPVVKVVDDLIYFTTNMPFNFDTATVKVYFVNKNADQTFSVGFQDQSDWHYNFKPFDAPFMNTLNWTRKGINTVLYQRQQQYPTVDTFLSNPPRNAIIGTFDYASDIGDDSQISLPNYQPSQQETIINTPFRGALVIYAYLDHEPFHMTIEKQDLNWYANPDTVTVSVYKNNNLVYQTTGDDDGITNGSRKMMPPENINIDNPGIPESGVYKIVIDANQDTIIKSIKTNLHKIVFQGSLFLAGNSDVYGPVIGSTSATTLYTNALSLSAVTYHSPGEQTIAVGSESAVLNTLQIPLHMNPPDLLTKIVVPQNDVVLSGFQGYFAFSPGQFFLPSNYYVMPITSKQDIKMVDYILTNYAPSHKEKGWQVNEQTFNLKTAYVNNNRLSWVIESPQLKQKNSSFMIKDIQVTLHKKGWL